METIGFAELPEGQRRVSASEVADALRAEGYLVIGRDENGEWPLDVVLALGAGVFDAESASVAVNVSPDARRFRFMWEQLILEGLDALAESSKGVE